MRQIGRIGQAFLIATLLLASKPKAELLPELSGLDRAVSVEEEDGSPSVVDVYKLKLPNGSITDNNDGTASVTFPSTSGDSVQVNGSDVDTTANFTNDGNVDFTLTDGGAGGPDAIKADFTEVDGSTTNEINTITGDDSNTTSGLAITIAGGGINATTVVGDTVTITGTETDPNALLTAGTDNVKDTHIDWGSGAGQVNLDDIPTGVTNVPFTSTLKTNYDTAYGWGNHASAGYLTTEVDPTVDTSAEIQAIIGAGIYQPAGSYQPLATILTTLSNLANGSGALTNNGSGTLSYVSYLTAEVDGSTTNEINTITLPDANVTAGLGITFAQSGAIAITESAPDTVTFTVTEADPTVDTSAEIQAIIGASVYEPYFGLSTYIDQAVKTTSTPAFAGALFTDKIKLTQTDGNEYIDSLADGFLDLGATMSIRSTNATVFSTAATSLVDSIYLKNTGATGGSGNIGSSIGFASPQGDRRAAIATEQLSADTDQVGFVFYGHSSAVGTDALDILSRLNMNGWQALAATGLYQIYHTTAPTLRLRNAYNDIYGEDVVAMIDFEAQDASTGRIAQQYAQIKALGYDPSGAGSAINGGIGEGGSLAFFTALDPTGNTNFTFTERMRILPSGYVGIGETAPQDTLEVNGTVLVKDKLKFTQDDGNEYIDSLNDGYIDVGATTGIRLLQNTIISTGKHLTFGAIQWDNGSDKIDGEQIADDTIDDDSIDFSDVTLADFDTEISAIASLANSAGYLYNDGSGNFSYGTPGGSGDVTSIGDCTTGACFDGTQGTALTFNNAGGDGTLDYDGTDFSISHPITVTGLLNTSIGIDGVGAVDLDYGSADITDHTFITDGTGDGEIVFPNDSIGADEIDSTTGAYDFGGVTSFEIPNGANPTCDASGEIAINTTDKTLELYNGTAQVAFPTIHVAQGTFDLAAQYDVDSDLWLIDLHADSYPHGIYITKIYVDASVADPTTELDANLMYCDAVADGAFPGANATLIKAIDTTTGNFADAAVNTAVATGKTIYIDMDADPTDANVQYHIRIHYYIPVS